MDDDEDDAPDLGDHKDDDDFDKVRMPPDCFELRQSSANGCCLFEAIGAGLAKASNKPSPAPARHIRAELALYPEKQPELNEHWDAKLPDGKSGAKWAVYLSSIRRTGSRGGAMELRAAAARWRRQIEVFVASGEPGYFYGVIFCSMESAIWLWYSNEHYDWLEVKE